MDLFPENKIVDSTPKNGLAPSLKSMDLFPQFADSSTKMFDGAEKPRTAQMTIFYAGQVFVFDDYPAHRAKEVMHLASKGCNSQAFAHQCNLASKIPNNQIKSNPKVPQIPVMSSSPIQDRPQRPVEAIASDLPIARRNSLHRFLEKRKDRITSKSPYPAAAASSASSKPTESKSWLSLAAPQ